MLFEDKIPGNVAAFKQAVIDVSAEIGIPADWMMLYMWMESRLSPTAVNPSSNATGLIQFMPSTAKSLGYTLAQIKAMSNVEQMRGPVREYMLRTKKERGVFVTLVDGYCAILLPAAVGKPMSYTLPSWAYSQNGGFDKNKDGKISKQELEDKLLSLIPDTVVRETIKKKAS